MAENFQNFYVTKLREACDAVATTIYVDTVPAITEGTLVIEYANSTKHEIIHFTGVSGYGLTGCTRGMEGTTAQSHSAGVDVRQNLTAGMIDKIINGVITTENIANSAVTTAKINDGAVTADKIDFTTLKLWTPDYSNYGSTNLWASSSTTTITENGFVYAFINAYKINTNSETNIKINGKIVARGNAEARGPNSAVVCDCSGTFPVSAGDKVSYDVHSGTINTRDCYFIPGKWVTPTV